jgi:NDP-hexose 4-ketoreductase
MNQSSRRPRVLIAGANGFIGRHVSQTLVEVLPDADVLRLGRRIAQWSEGGNYLSSDAAGHDTSYLTKLFRDHNVEAVVNCAGTTRSQSGALHVENVVNTKELVEAAADACPGMLFCQIGSSAEYTMLPRPEKTREDSPARPETEYGRSKLAASNIVLSATREGRIAGYVLRLFNPIGVGMPATQLVGRLLNYFSTGGVGTLSVGALETYRDYFDVRDAAKAVVSSLSKRDLTCGQVINIGSGLANGTAQLVQGILAEAKCGAIKEDSEAGSARSEGIHWQEANISKARHLLEWEPVFSFADTVSYLGSCASRLASLSGRAENRV